ncbi:MAG: hypothetical protein N7Q72_04445 [Spiroplasma sp. Tabriz.8]|nr:hypothetical protein [Spiroplasma sp. Tabriz.8]
MHVTFSNYHLFYLLKYELIYIYIYIYILYCIWKFSEKKKIIIK